MSTDLDVKIKLAQQNAELAYLLNITLNDPKQDLIDSLSDVLVFGDGEIQMKNTQNTVLFKITTGRSIQQNYVYTAMDDQFVHSIKFCFDCGSYVMGSEKYLYDIMNSIQELDEAEIFQYSLVSTNDNELICKIYYSLICGYYFNAGRHMEPFQVHYGSLSVLNKFYPDVLIKLQEYYS